MTAQRPPDRRYTDGRDEMNLAEFPISVLQRQQPVDGQGVKLDTVTYHSSRYDPLSRRRLQQRVTLETTSRHGLPTPADENVVLALLHVAKHTHNFADPVVHFSPRQLFQLMGWAPNSRSYIRLRDVLRRLKALVIRYENSWWDVAGRGYEAEFATGIITEYELARQVSGRKKGATPPSWVRWTPHFQQSLSNGNLKKLDLERLFALRLPTAQRMYRFLDKRFYPPHQPPRVEMDLHDFAYGHVGLSPVANVAELKRRLAPAIAELEGIGFIAAAPAAQRYQKVKTGVWRVRFDPGPQFLRNDLDLEGGSFGTPSPAGRESITVSPLVEEGRLSPTPLAGEGRLSPSPLGGEGGGGGLGSPPPTPTLPPKGGGGQTALRPAGGGGAADLSQRGEGRAALTGRRSSALPREAAGVPEAESAKPQNGVAPEPAALAKAALASAAGSAAVEREIAAAYYRLWDPQQIVQPGESDLAQVRELLARHGPDRAREVIPHLVQVVKRKWPQCKSLSGALGKYLAEALHACERERRRRDSLESAMLQQQRERDEAQRRIEDSRRLEARWEALPTAERRRIEDEILDRYPEHRERPALLKRLCLDRLARLPGGDTPSGNAGAAEGLSRNVLFE